jgi:myosin tail region-interacting protein MTI1
MADDEPPRPKPGSLKDRIKQFEASSSAQANTSAPPPLRPKPGNLGQWKPKPIDPPSPSKQTAFPQEDAESPVKSGQGGMSATDAASSIAQGGSLKERMAALQGKGAFGNPSAASNAPPLPSNEGKPRVWKTSKAPLPERKDEVNTVGNEDSSTPTKEHPSNADDDLSHKESYTQEHIPEVRTSNAEEDDAGETAGTEDDEERERRAAIAARMARLGGARLGMPVGFGVAAKGLHSPSKPKIVSSGDEESNTDPSSSVVSPTESHKESAAPKPRTTLDTALAIPLPTSQGSLLSPGEVSGEIYFRGVDLELTKVTLNGIQIYHQILMLHHHVNFYLPVRQLFPEVQTPCLSQRYQSEQLDLERRKVVKKLPLQRVHLRIAKSYHQ